MQNGEGSFKKSNKTQKLPEGVEKAERGGMKE